METCPKHTATTYLQTNSPVSQSAVIPRPNDCSSHCCGWACSPIDRGGTLHLTRNAYFFPFSCVMLWSILTSRTLECVSFQWFPFHTASLNWRWVWKRVKDMQRGNRRVLHWLPYSMTLNVTQAGKLIYWEWKRCNLPIFSGFKMTSVYPFVITFLHQN